ncbi:nucleoside hydrolase [Gordonia sp. PKS22-38]|uniref:Nucleoside hydrolase n=1 Tax=Gordonia prachuapensis TaxID=3115651 RepID=A0ABU7MUA0_9ACTN|nr:nucleoside hydrolase [Gordonia sp. PKS22-38]
MRRPHREPDSADVIRGFARNHPGGTLLCLGPLTNLARVIIEDPTALTGLGSIVISGGVGFGGRGVRQLSDTNTRCDPRAAAVVARAASLPIRWVGLDVSSALGLRAVDLPSSGIGDFTSLRGYGLLRRNRGFRGWSAPCHDLVAAAVALDDDCVRTRPGRMAVRADVSPAHLIGVPGADSAHRIATAVDVDQVRGFLTRWTSNS